MAETYQSKYTMNFHENSGCTIFNDAHFHDNVTICAGNADELKEIARKSQEEADQPDEADPSSNQDESTVYPEIKNEQQRFFAKTFKSESIKEGKKVKREEPVPVKQILYRIYDLAKDGMEVRDVNEYAYTFNWSPSKYSSAINWAIMYRVLEDLNYFTVSVRPKFAAYLRCVVCYCFPDTPSRYSDSIQNQKIDFSITELQIQDRALYQYLKRELSLDTKIGE